MTNHSLSALLTALDIAAFERVAAGEFQPLAPPPAWFARLSRDGTFPFLGHLLEEAEAFWASGDEGARQWGPSVDVGDDGSELHYLVKALRISTGLCLVFQRDESAEVIREVLQKVRANALAAAQKPPPR